MKAHRHTTAPLLVTVRLTDKLPHGPYVEGTPMSNNLTVHVPPTSTVGTVKEAFAQFATTWDQQATNNLNQGRGAMAAQKMVKVSASPTILQVKCKGGVVTDEELLSDLLEDGETMEMTIDEDISIRICILC
jgi:hypothetical protein